MFSHSGFYSASCAFLSDDKASLYNQYCFDFSQILLSDKDKYSSQCRTRAKSAIYDCLVFYFLSRIKSTESLLSVVLLCAVTLLDTTLKESLEWVTYTRQHDDPQKRGVSCFLLT